MAVFDNKRTWMFMVAIIYTVKFLIFSYFQGLKKISSSMKSVKRHFCVGSFSILNMESFWILRAEFILILAVKLRFQGLKKISSIKWVEKDWNFKCGIVLKLKCSTTLNLKSGTTLNLKCGTLWITYVF